MRGPFDAVTGSARSIFRVVEPGSRYFAIERLRPRRPECGFVSRCALMVVVCLAGCQLPQSSQTAPLTVPSTLAPAAQGGTPPEYAVVFPDVLETRVPGKTSWSGQHLVMPDGTLEFGDGERIAVQNLTVGQIRDKLAEAAGVPVSDVRCVVSQHRSRVIYLSGEIAGAARTVPYTGPERVADVIRRIGGVTDAGDVQAITVVRRNAADGMEPQTYLVDLKAIRGGDSRGNMLIEPNDRIIVGESRRSKVTRALPIDLKWMTKEWTPKPP
jgi:protein involved in polysaccharide export with SLBB domain